jgi:dipeptidyl aminopeptidase/acylaminoacyl peptidase
MKTVCLLWVLSCSLVTSGISDPADSKTARTPSPDGSFIAVISSTEEQSPENTVTIVSKEKGSQAEFPMTSQGGGNGRHVLKSEWSPDSKFFVFSTFSAGAHSSWNFKTFVYSVDANKFVSVDEKVRPVTDERFQLISPHTLQVETLNPSGIDFPSFKRTVDLPTLFR